MRDADIERFQGLLTDAMAFYGKDVSEFAMDVWWAACKGFDFEQVSKALTAHAMDPERGHFAPRPADIVRQLQGTRTDASLVAWGKVLAATSDVGAYRDVAFDDPVIHAVVHDLGGWPKVCRTNYDELGYVQHRFTEAYRTYAARGPGEYPAQLAGDSGSHELYARRGLPPPKPALVGDKAKALEVMRLGGPARAAAPRLLAMAPVLKQVGR